MTLKRTSFVLKNYKAKVEKLEDDNSALKEENLL
jgi:hypothetical protein